MTSRKPPEKIGAKLPKKVERKGRDLHPGGDQQRLKQEVARECTNRRKKLRFNFPISTEQLESTQRIITWNCCNIEKHNVYSVLVSHQSFKECNNCFNWKEIKIEKKTVICCVIIFELNRLQSNDEV